MVKIMSHGEAIKALKVAPGEIAVICVTDPGLSPDAEIVENALEVLHLDFVDSHVPRKTVKVVSREDVERAISFAEDHGDVMVCCHAGVSRSAALAYVIECLEVRPQMAANIWDKNRHQPNPVIIKLGSEILDNPKIMQSYEKWVAIK